MTNEALAFHGRLACSIAPVLKKSDKQIKELICLLLDNLAAAYEGGGIEAARIYFGRVKKAAFPKSEQPQQSKKSKEVNYNQRKL